MSKRFALRHTRTGRLLATVARAQGWWQLGWGVIGQPALAPQTGLWLPGVAAIHTCFVRFPLDLLFLDSELRTVRVCPAVPPWRLWVRARGAQHTIELATGTMAAADIRPGDAWTLVQINQ